MKKLTMSLTLLAVLAMSTGCGGNENGTVSTDSSSVTTQSTDTTATTSSTTNRDTSMAADREFVMEAASGGLMEVALGRLARTNGSSAAVKEFGQMMVADHTKANTELKAVAAKKGLTVSPTPIEKHQKNIDELSTKKGADFDKAYVELMVDDHKEDIDNFQSEADKGNDADVKAFAVKTLPVLRKHYEHIQKIQDGMK